MPVKRLVAAVAMMVIACIGGYLLTPKWQAVRQEQARLADPLHAFSDENIQEKQLLSLQSQIRTTPQDGVLWAQLGEYYLWQNAYHNALLAYEQALRFRGKTPKSIRRWRRYCITRPGSI
ncbi:nrfG protein [Shigella flexneri 1235-66]|nr:nrfG protein [Shigella flexneri 1235-66]